MNSSRSLLSSGETMVDFDVHYELMLSQAADDTERILSFSSTLPDTQEDVFLLQTPPTASSTPKKNRSIVSQSLIHRFAKGIEGGLRSFVQRLNAKIIRLETRTSKTTSQVYRRLDQLSKGFDTMEEKNRLLRTDMEQLSNGYEDLRRKLNHMEDVLRKVHSAFDDN